jgi:hypothetical protein
MLGVLVAPVQAHGRRRGNDCCNECCAAPCCTPCQPQITYVDKQVTCYRPEWREREVPCTINRVTSKVVVTPVNYTVCVPVYSEEKRTITVMNQVPHQVEREVTCCRMVPVCITDPCTGCTRTCCKPETYTQKVTCTVMECVPSQREITVKVCNFRQEQRTGECRRVVCECHPETIMQKQRYCVMVPYQQTVKVAVCTPCCQ